LVGYKEGVDTREAILDSAQRLVQERGFNGFSYADIAIEVGVRKASLHHHFATKTDLGLALIDRYVVNFGVALAALSAAKVKAETKLQRYVDLYRSTLVLGRMCLCGMLATEATTLDPALAPQLKRFFDQQTDWLATVFKQGRAEGRMDFAGNVAEMSATFLATLQGALMMSRSTNDVTSFDRMAATAVKMVMSKS
jgi:TetR/AcrR family transcriptional regulator, transcriptional repressor for nem operon